MHRRLLPFGFAATLAGLACGSSGDETASGTTTGGVITGAGGATSSVSASTGLPHHPGAGGSGGSGGGHGAPYPVVLAHGFFGFEDFAGAGFLSYFYGVRDALAAEGEVVYTPAVDPFNDSDTRGAELLERVKEVLAETGAAKVNLVGHSQGGLDARVVANLRPDLVASVVSVGTPHHGTPVADVLLELVSDPNYQDAIDAIVRIIGAPLWDQAGNESSVFAPLRLFSQPGIQAFNAAHPDEPGVFYASVAGRTANHDKDADCHADVLLSFVAQYDQTVDPTDPLLAVTELVCADGWDDIANDGLIRARDARWGEFWGCVPADHLDEIGQLLGDDPGGDNAFDHVAFYRDTIAHLRNLGL